MKKLIVTLGVICLICSILLFVASGKLEEEAQGSYVSSGVIINGVYKDLGQSGYLGRNEKGIENAGWLKGIAVVAGFLGIGCIIASRSVKEPEKPQY